jgi:hypothetical protein
MSTPAAGRTDFLIEDNESAEDKSTRKRVLARQGA